MNFLELDKNYQIDMNSSITENNTLTIDDISDRTYNQLSVIDKSLEELKNENIELFVDKSGHGFLFKKYEKLIWYRTDKYINELKDNFPDSKFSPYINLYLRTKTEYRKVDDIFFLATLKNGLLSDTFKKEIAQQRKYDSEYKKEVRNYINGLFDYRSRLLVIRIDLSYRKGLFRKVTTNILNKPLSKKEHKLEALKAWSLEVKEHRKTLFKYLKKQYSKGFIGYMWKLEYTEIKSFHYHMMFFLDGSEHREDITIAQKIGELWVDEITQGDGLYWNCNAHKDKYRNLGIGAINHHDTVLKDNMLNTALYLVKKDYLIRSVMFNAKNRAFGKGQIPEKSKSGRPRKKE